MARDRVKSELDARKDRVVNTLDGVADAVRRVGVPLREQSGALAAYANQAAERVERLAAGLRERDVVELGQEVEDFARSHPRAFLATGVAAGIVAARFLKSSAPEGRDRPGSERTEPGRTPRRPRR